MYQVLPQMAHPRRERLKGVCYYCIKLVKWIPVVFIVIIILWSYYAYVHQLCIITVQSKLQQVLYLTFYHILFLMLCWTYAKTIFTDIGCVPGSFKLPEMEYELINQAESIEIQHQILEHFSRQLPVTNINMNGSVRYCDKCKHVKPDRTHHCSVCGECVLKMDHHCPWVNNCVCFTNYKFFILFLGYALLYCIYIVLSSLPFFIAFWKGDLEGVARFHILFLFFVALMFGISLVSLFTYHCYLVSENRTTLEAFRAPIFKRVGADRNGFNLGCYRNFEEVFGRNPSTWLIPVRTSLGDGITFPRLEISEEREGLLKSEDGSP